MTFPGRGGVQTGSIWNGQDFIVLIFRTAPPGGFEPPSTGSKDQLLDQLSFGGVVTQTSYYPLGTYVTPF